MPGIIALLLLPAALQPMAIQLPLLAGCLILAALQVFVAWRGIRLKLTKGYRSGRDYERRFRHELPPEYHDSEDALLAAWRRKRAKLTPPPARIPR